MGLTPFGCWVDDVIVRPSICEEVWEFFFFVYGEEEEIQGVLEIAYRMDDKIFKILGIEYF